MNKTSDKMYDETSDMTYDKTYDVIILGAGPAGMFALNKSLEIARKNDAELHIFHALDYLLQDHDEKDPKLIAAKKEKQQRYKTEVEPLVGDLKNVTFKCLPADVTKLELWNELLNFYQHIVDN